VPASPLGFIGFGSLAQHLYTGFTTVAPNACFPALKKTPFHACPPNIIPSPSLPALHAAVPTILLAIKPQHLPALIPQLRQLDWQHKTVLSVLAGTSLATLASAFPDCPRIVRLMPNTAAQCQASMTVFCTSFTVGTTEPPADWVTLFRACGDLLHIAEKHMDVCTAACGSGPAFFYQLLQTLCDYLHQQGLTPDHARLLTTQLCNGVAAMLTHHQSSPLPTLIKDICSPGGTTEAGLNHMAHTHLATHWRDVFVAAQARAKELSNTPPSQ